MKKKIVSVVAVFCGIAVVFSVTRLKPKASSITERKDGLELVSPGTDISSGSTSNDSNNSSNCNKGEGKLEFDKGTVSHVCYLYIDNNDNIKFHYKDDSVGNKNCVSFPYKKDCSLVVFIKQSTSGMIWCEKQISKDMLDKVVEVVKKNDKSYKGCEGFAYGNGEHKFTYHKGTNKEKTVKYHFSCGSDGNNNQNNIVDKECADKPDKSKDKLNSNNKDKNNSCDKTNSKKDKDKNNSSDKKNNNKDKNNNKSNKTNKKDKDDNSNSGSSDSTRKDGLELVQPNS